jgi:hypothetical protein
MQRVPGTTNLYIASAPRAVPAVRAPRSAASMPDTVFFVLLQFHAESIVGRDLRYLARQQLLMAAYDLLALRVVAPNIQRDAVMQAAIAMFLRFERRESSFSERYQYRVHRQEDRALQVFPWLPAHFIMKQRIRLLAHAHQVLVESVEAFLLERPRMRSAMARHRASAEARIAVDESSTSSSEDEQ